MYKQLYERRLKLCRKKEVHFWSQIDEKFMTEEESDENDVTVLYQHKPHWRSESNLSTIFCAYYVCDFDEELPDFSSVTGHVLE